MVRCFFYDRDFPYLPGNALSNPLITRKNININRKMPNIPIPITENEDAKSFSILFILGVFAIGSPVLVDVC